MWNLGGKDTENQGKGKTATENGNKGVNGKKLSNHMLGIYENLAIICVLHG